MQASAVLTPRIAHKPHHIVGQIYNTHNLHHQCKTERDVCALTTSWGWWAVWLGVGQPHWLSDAVSENTGLEGLEETSVDFIS